MVLPGYIVEAATRETEASDLETLKDWVESGGDINVRSLALRGRAKPDALLAAVARLPNEMAWHVLSFWRAEADVAPPSTPSPRPPPIISDEALLSELDGLVQAQKAQRGGG